MADYQRKIRRQIHDHPMDFVRLGVNLENAMFDFEKTQQSFEPMVLRFGLVSDPVNMVNDMLISCFSSSDGWLRHY